MSDSFGNAFAMSRLTGMSAEQVKAQFGNAFLVIQGKSPSSRQHDDDTSEIDLNMDSPQAPTRGLVYVLAKKPSSTFAWVSVGRHENNDVWMPHSSVSRFHALVRDDGASLSVQDARSANGTFVQNEPVKSHGAGDATPIKPGSEIRFGDIITLFLDATALVLLGARTRSKGPMPGVGST
jgi:pSer/pThr/pTyr-binding forkhead associated (FHA) protein